MYLLPYISLHATFTYKIFQGIEQVTKTCQGSISGITSASGKLPKAS
jgi:hypothetical protein